MVEIRLNDVSQMFEGREVLHQITCSFQGGRVTAVAGANGSGKSTLLRLAARLMLPTSGTVDTFWDGVPVKGPEYRSLLALATPEMEMYTRLTVRENLIFLLSARGIASNDDTMAALLERVGLPREVLPRMMGQLSTGMRQRVRLAVVLGTDAEVWLLDEPGLALDEHGRALLLSETRAAAKRGRLILWATNEPEERKAADACFDLTSDTQRRP
ncbi:MAG: ATP-binding cassette domain-containing protein [Selenomonas massiliensis]